MAAAGPTPQTITCTHCGAEIPLEAALARRLEAEAAQKLAEKERGLQQGYEAKLRLQREQAEAERAKAVQAAQAAAVQGVELTVRDLSAQLAEAKQARTAAAARELDLLKQKRDLEQSRAELELSVARRLEQERAALVAQTTTRVGEEAERRVREKEEQLAALRRQLDEAQRKAAQGSMQTQGEAAEVALEEALRAAFPLDAIEPVGKGVRGADIIHRVHGASGRACGTLLWESKDTKAFNEKWLAKLKDDARELRADVPVLVSAVLPEGLVLCGMVQGVWVVAPRAAIEMAAVLRNGLVEVATARAAGEGRSGKAEAAWGYLTSPAFRQRLEAFVESVVHMREDLDAEKRGVQAAWARREIHIKRAVEGVAGLYGDMQGLVGPALPRVEHLELPPPPPATGF